MGYQNAYRAYANWGHLPDRPFRLLVFMALRSRDTDDPPIFREGRDAAARALGRFPPAPPGVGDESVGAEKARKIRRADYESVKAATRVLLNTGAATQVRAPGPRQNAEYALDLGPALTPSGQGEPVEQGRPSLTTGQGELVERGRAGLSRTEEGDKDMMNRPRSPEPGTSPGPRPVSDQPDHLPQSRGRTCPHGQPLTRLGGPDTEDTCGECRRERSARPSPADELLNRARKGTQ